MRHRNIQITQVDQQRLAELLRSDPLASDGLRGLVSELKRATVVAASEVSPDVITMNSKVQLTDLESGREMIYTLVFPEDADVAAGKVSVLSPIGTAMLGYRVGDEFEWEVPAGKRRYRVDALLYQPEAAGEDLA